MDLNMAPLAHRNMNFLNSLSKSLPVGNNRSETVLEKAKLIHLAECNNIRRKVDQKI